MTKNTNDKHSLLQKHGEPDSDKQDADDKHPSITSSYKPKKSKKKQKVTQAEFTGTQFSGLRQAGQANPMSLGKGFGDWEKHTRGIGAKLLLKMGFEAGKGLGKELQGRSTIVEAHLRKGRGAIGAYGKEGNRPKRFEQKDSEEEVRFPMNLTLPKIIR